MTALDFPATGRNKTYISERIAALVPPEGPFNLLEIASGSGQHAVHFAQRWPQITVHPSDPDPDHRASIRAWATASGARNVSEPLDLDTTGPWAKSVDFQVDALLCCNMIHIAPWSACEGLFAGAPHVMGTQAVLCLYGPFMRGGSHSAPSNAAFSASLRARDPSWGVRDLDEVTALAHAIGLSGPEVHEMPANNLFVVFRR